jgi:hypothetical protein
MTLSLSPLFEWVVSKWGEGGVESNLGTHLLEFEVLDMTLPTEGKSFKAWKDPRLTKNMEPTPFTNSVTRGWFLPRVHSPVCPFPLHYLVLYLGATYCLSSPYSSGQPLPLTTSRSGPDGLKHISPIPFPWPVTSSWVGLQLQLVKCEYISWALLGLLSCSRGEWRGKLCLLQLEAVLWALAEASFSCSQQCRKVERNWVQENEVELLDPEIHAYSCLAVPMN